MSDKIRVGINGFGRIGKTVFKSAFKHPKIEICVINDLTDSKTLAHLLQYDSIYGIWDRCVKKEDGALEIEGNIIPVTSIPNLEDLRWKDYDVDIVIESTGIFTNANIARKHITHGGASKVLISAPAKNEDITIVKGINDHLYDKNKHHVISNASCTTNCLAPIAKVLMEHCGIHSGFMTTIHSYTSDQKILDLPHKDLRRSRAAATSIIPTTTGAAKAVSLVLPELKGKLDGLAMRVPTSNVSIVDLVVYTEKSTSIEKVNEAMKTASEKSMKGILGYSTEPLVSIDYKGNPLSSIVDSLSTSVINENLVKILSWYDNEWGYSNRVVDIASSLI